MGIKIKMGSALPAPPPPNMPPFTRRDLGIPVPDDGYQYVMAQHEVVLFGITRHSYNGTWEPIPAVVNADWGIVTQAVANGDYFPIPSDEWQWWFYKFWDWASWYRLPVGEKVGTHVNPKNPNIIYDDYTPGSKLALYSGMIMDAKSHSDSANPQTGARDVVTGSNLDSRFPWAWLCRPCTGALLRVKGRVGAKLKIQCIDFLKPPPPIDSLEPWQFYFGTQVHSDGRVTRYPDVKNAFEVWGLEPAGTAMPLIAPGGEFLIRKNACLELQPGQIWKPYYP